MRLVFAGHGHVFVLVPKAASTSIRCALGAGSTDCPWCAVGDYRLPHIAFVRHPVDRLASVWRHLVRDIWHPRMQSMGVQPGEDFSIFVERIIGIPDCLRDPHVRTQSALLPSLDFVGRVETLYEDWASLGLPPIQCHNTTQDHGRIDPGLRSRIEDAYASDMRRFGYEGQR